jgi:hypothetical protein
MPRRPQGESNVRKSLVESVLEEIRQEEMVFLARRQLKDALAKRFRKLPSSVTWRIDDTSHLGRLRAALLDVNKIESPEDLRV